MRIVSKHKRKRRQQLSLSETGIEHIDHPHVDQRKNGHGCADTKDSRVLYEDTQYIQKRNCENAK